MPYSVCIVYTWTFVSIPFHRTLIHSFTFFSHVTVKSLCHSVFGPISSCNWRSFDPLTYSGRSLGHCFLSLITSLGVVPKKKGKREGGDGWYARDSLVFIRVAKLINFAWPRRAACLPLKLWKESSKEKERDSLLSTVSPIRHGYVTVVKLTLRDACHVWDWSLTVLFQRTDSGEGSVRQNRFHGRNMNAHTCTRKLGMLLYVGDRKTEKNRASSLELGKSLLRGAMSSSCMQDVTMWLHTRHEIESFFGGSWQMFEYFLSLLCNNS